MYKNRNHIKIKSTVNDDMQQNLERLLWIANTFYGHHKSFSLKITTAHTHWCPWHHTFWINQHHLKKGVDTCLPHFILEVFRARLSPIQYFDFTTLWKEHGRYLDAYSFALLIRSIETRRIEYWIKSHYPHLYYYVQQREDPIRDIPALMPYFHSFCLALSHKKRLYAHKIRAPMAHSLYDLHDKLHRYECDSYLALPSSPQFMYRFEKEIKPQLRKKFQNTHITSFSLYEKQTLFMFWQAWSAIAIPLITQAHDLYSQDIQRIASFLQDHHQFYVTMDTRIQHRRCVALLCKIQSLKPSLKIPQSQELYYASHMLQHMSQEVELFDDSIIYARQHAYKPFEPHLRYKPSQLRGASQDVLLPIWSYYEHRLDQCMMKIRPSPKF